MATESRSRSDPDKVSTFNVVFVARSNQIRETKRVIANEKEMIAFIEREVLDVPEDAARDAQYFAATAAHHQC